MKEIFDIEAWREVIVSSLTELGSSVAGFLPNLLGALVILALGWLVSRIVGTLTSRVLHRVRLDDASERLGVSRSLRNGGLHKVPSRILGRLVFWVLMLTFLLSAVETLGLSAVTGTIDRLIGFLPSVIAAALIVVIGLLLARFTGNLVGSGAATANLAYAQQLGAVAHGAVVVMVGVLALEQLGVDTQLLLTVIAAALGALGLGVALAFGFGARDVMSGILAGHYLRQSFEEGDPIQFGGRKGRIERIGPVDTVVRDGERAWSVPNTVLLGEVVER